MASLAERAGIDKRTLDRLKERGGAAPSTIRAIATALGTTYAELTGDRAASNATTAPVRVSIRIRGTLPAAAQDALIRLTPQIREQLEGIGLRMTTQSVAVASRIAGRASDWRVLLALTGISARKPAWLIAAVRPAALPHIVDGMSIDPHRFPYGEVIQSGLGKRIPPAARGLAATLFACSESSIIDAK